MAPTSARGGEKGQGGGRGLESEYIKALQKQVQWLEMEVHIMKQKATEARHVVRADPSSVLDEHVTSLRAKCIDMQQKYEAEVAKAEEAQTTYERERAHEEVKLTMIKDEQQWMQLQLSAALTTSKISSVLQDLQKAETAVQLKLAQLKDTKATVQRRLKDAGADRSDLAKYDEVRAPLTPVPPPRSCCCHAQATREEVPLKKKLDFIQGRQQHAKQLQQRVGELLHLINGEHPPPPHLLLLPHAACCRARLYREQPVRQTVPRSPQPGAAPPAAAIARARLTPRCRRSCKS